VKALATGTALVPVQEVGCHRQGTEQGQAAGTVAVAARLGTEQGQVGTAMVHTARQNPAQSKTAAVHRLSPMADCLDLYPQSHYRMRLCHRLQRWRHRYRQLLPSQTA
jgi:Na+/phosphate symporter